MPDILAALTAFLAARLDEWEAAAKVATDGPWHIDGMSIRGADRAYSGGREDAVLVVKHTWPQEAAHIVLHDPATALRQVAAMRAHIRAWETFAVNFTHVDENVFEFAKREALEDVLAWDAAVFSSHPDYRKGWTP